ncbi:hypothetical protein ECZU34_16920 [Escherichia coli]|nr:hypothetical protein ECZU34_16920 [Escherichia coli]
MDCWTTSECAGGAKEIPIMGFSPWVVAKSVRQSASPTFELFIRSISPVLKSVFKLEPGFEQL